MHQRQLQLYWNKPVLRDVPEALRLPPIYDALRTLPRVLIIAKLRQLAPWVIHPAG
jgi:hypothetical protein